MPSRKEPNYFTHEELGTQGIYYGLTPVASWDDYQALFADAGDAAAIGEASVSYLFYRYTAARIRKRLPAARILIILRDPVERAFSHYLMDQRLGHVHHSLRELLGAAPLVDTAKLFYQQYVEVGLYHDQVKRYLDVFAAEQVKIFLYEDLAESDTFSSDVFRFLDIDPGFVPRITDPANTYIAARVPLVARLYAMPGLRRAARRLTGQRIGTAIKHKLFRREPKPILDPGIRARLRGLYRDDVARLQDLIGRDLSAWCQDDPAL